MKFSNLFSVPKFSNLLDLRHKIHNELSVSCRGVKQTLSSSVPRSTSAKADCDTLSKASGGHSVNQSMVQQFTRDGNIRHRVLNALPTGLIHNTI